MHMAKSLTAQAHAQAATNTLTLPGGSTNRKMMQLFYQIQTHKL